MHAEIFRFTVYNVVTDQTSLTPRWGTLRAIAAAQGAALPDTRIEVDAAALDGSGLTATGFDPGQHPPRQF